VSDVVPVELAPLTGRVERQVPVRVRDPERLGVKLNQIPDEFAAAFRRPVGPVHRDPAGAGNVKGEAAARSSGAVPGGNGDGVGLASISSFAFSKLNFEGRSKSR